MKPLTYSIAPEPGEPTPEICILVDAVPPLPPKSSDSASSFKGASLNFSVSGLKDLKTASPTQAPEEAEVSDIVTTEDTQEPDFLAPDPKPSSSDDTAEDKAPERCFGWVKGAFPAPFEDDHYIVEFLEDNQVKILAYMDNFGRAFTTNKPVTAPPAREPDLHLVLFADRPKERDVEGLMSSKNSAGKLRTVARVLRHMGLYNLRNSWYDFGNFGADLTYADMMARVYLACVFRPTLTKIPVPTSGMSALAELLDAPNLARGLRALCVLMDQVAEDPSLKAPALARLFVKWLDEAGFTGPICRSWLVGYEGDDDQGPLRAIKTRRYANTYYVTAVDNGLLIPMETVWGIQSAMNRFLLLKETFGKAAANATMEDCVKWDRYLRLTIAAQAPLADSPLDQRRRQALDDWDCRLFISQTMERLRLPYPYDAVFNLDLEAPGRVEFVITGPSANLMPKSYYEESARQWYETSESQREYQAWSYSAHLGIALAAAAFASSVQVEEVQVTACPLLPEWGVARPNMEKPFYQVVFNKRHFCANGSYRNATQSDPRTFYESFRSYIDSVDQLQRPFEAFKTRPSFEARTKAPELMDGPLGEAAQIYLGAKDMDDLRITLENQREREAERLADILVTLDSLSDAIREVRQLQNQTGDPAIYAGCTRLMTELTQGSLALTDRAALIETFLGSDPFSEAFQQAQAFAMEEPDRAVALLMETIEEAQSSGRFTDTPEVVHRFFDSYTGRILYNLHTHDRDKSVSLVPITLVMCYLEAIHLMDTSFTDSELAVNLGERILEIAPTFSLAYRRCARAFMLTGDLENAQALLTQALEVTINPDEIAASYYQLGYVLWRRGYPEAGLACYCKSLLTKPIYATQASVEIRQLLVEEGIEMISGSRIDSAIREVDIPIAPVPSLLNSLERAIEVAVNSNLFEVARRLLLAYIQYRADDAYNNVIRSLDIKGLDSYDFSFDLVWPSFEFDSSAPTDV